MSEDVQIGDYVFTDSHGIKRYRGRSCNIYRSADDADRSARLYLRPSIRHTAEVYVWHTTDGLYDYTLTPNANDGRLPELVGAELVSGASTEPETT